MEESDGATSCFEDSSSPLVLSGSVLLFLIGSRGSSWQRCPIFRLIHRVHGRS